MNTLQTERVEAFYTATKKLGRWTGANHFEVRARRGYAVLDLRAVDGDIEVRVDTERSAIKLLVPENAVIDQWDLRVTGRRSRVKDWTRTPDQAGPRVRLVGELRNGEIRVTRGGVATLSAMLTREFINDCIESHRNATTPTVHDPVSCH